MRARAGDPPRTMAQKILAARSTDPSLSGDLVEAKVDQVVLVAAPRARPREALAAGLKKTPVEVAVAYDGALRHRRRRPATTPRRRARRDCSPHGVLVARAGVGFPAPVHLERFASPARLCVTDEPRLAGVGGIGMLTLVVADGVARAGARARHGRRPAAGERAGALCGRLRPFVCARDVALELVRRGLADVVRRVEEAQRRARRRSSSPGRARAPSPSASAACSRASRRSSAPPRRSSSATSGRRSSSATSAAPRRTARSSPDAGAPCEDVVDRRSRRGRSAAPRRERPGPRRARPRGAAGDAGRARRRQRRDAPRSVRRRGAPQEQARPSAARLPARLPVAPDARGARASRAR